MEVKIIATIYADIKIDKPKVIDSDTIGDYKAELDASTDNAALFYLNDLKAVQSITIESCEPVFDGIDEYSEYLNNWIKEYPKLIKKYQQ